MHMGRIVDLAFLGEQVSEFSYKGHGNEPQNILSRLRTAEKKAVV